MPPQTTATPPLESGLLALPPDVENRLPYFGKSEVLRWVLHAGMQYGDPGPANELRAFADPTSYGEDIQAALRVHDEWVGRDVLHTGDSRTLLIGTYTLMAMEEQAGKAPRTVALTPMQIRRSVEYSPNLPKWSLKRLGKLSGKTTQFASMAILLQDRDPEEIDDYIHSLEPLHRPMIEKTLRVKRDWLVARVLERPFQFTQADRELTILRQFQAFYTRIATGERPVLQPKHSEDAADCVMNGDLTLDEAIDLFPMLAKHETPRHREIADVMEQKIIDTSDHRMGMSGITSRHTPIWTDKTETAMRKTSPQYSEAVAAAYTHATGRTHVVARAAGLNWLAVA
jgi:hypothetical protein